MPATLLTTSIEPQSAKLPEGFKLLSKSESTNLLWLMHLLNKSENVYSFREALLKTLPKIIDCSFTAFAQLDDSYQIMTYDTSLALEDNLDSFDHSLNHRLTRIHSRWNQSLLNPKTRVPLKSKQVFHHQSIKENGLQEIFKKIGLANLGVNYACGALIEGTNNIQHQAALFIYRDTVDFTDRDLRKVALINEIISPIYRRLSHLKEADEFILKNQHAERNSFLALTENGLRPTYASSSALKMISQTRKPNHLPLATLNDIHTSLPLIKDGRISKNTKVALKLPELQQVYVFWDEARKLVWIEVVDASPLKKLLTKKQGEVFEFIIQGLSNSEISYELGNSTRTVEKHVEQIFRRIKVDNRAKLVQLYESQ